MLRSRPLTRVFYLCALAAFLPPTASFAQRTSVARDFPIYDNGGKPDLALDPQRFVVQMEIVDRYFAPEDCAIAEEVVGAPGYRRLLRFDTVLMNRGDGDLVVGDRSDPDASSSSSRPTASGGRRTTCTSTSARASAWS